MSEKNSFDQLATEILFDIFDYLSYDDIIYTFFYLNQRFNSILLQHHRFLNYFTTPTSHCSFWQTILPLISSRIEYLTITIPDFSFSLDLFPKLKSLIISSSLTIYYDQLTPILESKQFKKLTSLKIKGEIIDRIDDRQPSISEKIFRNENSLHTYEYLPRFYQHSIDVNNLKVNVNLYSLSLKITGCKFLFQLLSYTPNLKYLNLVVLNFFDSNKRSNLNMNFSSIKLKKLSFAVEYSVINQRSFSFLTSFIKQFSSSLNYLSLDFSSIKIREFKINGFILQQQLLESMIQLKSFHFYIKFETSPFMYDEHFLSTFENQFWLDHHWTVGAHKTYLYTLPFHFDQLNDFIDFDHIKLSNSNILNSLKIWSHVKSINFDYYFQFNPNVIEQLKLKMPNLISTTADIHLIWKLCENINETNQNDITFDNITIIHCEGSYLRAVKYLLIHIFPNTRKLILSYSAESVESSFLPENDKYFGVICTTADYIYSSRIEHVEIEIRSEEPDCDFFHRLVKCLVKELLKMFLNIQSFILHFYDGLRRPSKFHASELSKTIQLLNMEEFANIYQIKHYHSYLQFIKKQND